MRGLFFPFSCCYVVILVWSLILSGIIREALVLREEHWPPFPQPPRKLLDISQDNRRILDCLSFLVEKKEEKKRKKVTYFYSPSIPSLFSFGPIWHRVIEVVCCSILHARHERSRRRSHALYQILATGNLRLGPRRPETCLKLASMGYEDINSSPIYIKTATYGSSEP